jgi:hypothetical protein
VGLLSYCGMKIQLVAKTSATSSYAQWAAVRMSDESLPVASLATAPEQTQLLPPIVKKTFPTAL